MGRRRGGAGQSVSTRSSNPSIPSPLSFLPYTKNHKPRHAPTKPNPAASRTHSRCEGGDR